MSTEYNTQFLIGGKLVAPDSAGTFTTEDPARAEVLASVPAANKTDVDRAVGAAQKAFEKKWSNADPDHRATVLRRIAKVYREHEVKLTDIEVRNNGSTRPKMADDVRKAADRLEYYAGLVHEVNGETVETPGNTLNFTLREPIGVVAAVIPFNHPLSFLASKIGPALAAGNTIVLKPSEYTPLSALSLAELLSRENDVPSGVVNIITGGAETGSYLTNHQDVGMVSFVGSVKTGKEVMRSAASNVAPVLLELGGKNPSIVFPDADLDETIPGCVSGMSLNWQGQSCGSGSRLLVHETIHDEVVDGLIAEFESVRVGDPNADDIDMGAIVSKEQYEKVREYIRIGREGDATLCTGGGEVSTLDGYFVEPTIFDGVDSESRLAQDEIFGPVLSVIEWSDYQEMLDIANGVDYGLTASLWTENLRSGLETAKRLNVGYVWVNQHGPHYLGTPYGGVKESGIGRTNCLQDVYEHTQTKNVNVHLDHTRWEWDTEGL